MYKTWITVRLAPVFQNKLGPVVTTVSSISGLGEIFVFIPVLLHSSNTFCAAAEIQPYMLPAVLCLQFLNPVSIQHQPYLHLQLLKRFLEGGVQYLLHWKFSTEFIKFLPHSIYFFKSVWLDLNAIENFHKYADNWLLSAWRSHS